ncbi:hypothetical protein EZS27_012268 [termite gut metagenome]|uniref:Glycosyl hydrolase-like 10 domain-containing protein n=1 Tax=termite gut metagenome TaxID=433724 RepID=A0A5J4S2A9_9ZZZZ
MFRYFSLFLLLLFVTSLRAQPKYEVRAAWIATIYGLDWPKNKAVDASGTHRQQEELIAILDKLKAANFNTVLLQTRIRGNVIYPSAYESISPVFTGRVDGYPGYDPLAFAIEECHKRGMECHAWIVTIPLGKQKQVDEFNKKSILRKQPAICISYKEEWFLNPGHPQTKEYLMKIVCEVVEKYDIDGINFDYLRYPENIHASFDYREYKKYGQGKTLAQWRRKNITEILRYIHKGVKNLKPWIKVSSSPWGKQIPILQYPASYWSSYHTVHQDVALWLKEGLQDQVYPMMYFRGKSFYSFVLDWQRHSNGRQIIPGLGIYRLDAKESNWNCEDIERQIHFIRNFELKGTAYYRATYLTNNSKGLYDKLINKFYTASALPPPMPWIDSIPPSPPAHLTVVPISGGIRLNWNVATDNDIHNVPYYVIYASNTYPVNTSRSENIVAQRVRETNYIYVHTNEENHKIYFAVTATDRYGNESKAIQQVAKN